MILPLEKQVCSLEPSKRLKELGVKQESLFVWNARHLWVTLRTDVTAESFLKDLCAAFTVAELGEMLPKHIGANRIGTSWAKANGWHVFYHQDSIRYIPHIQTSNTEADARAKMLIYLLENKLISL